MNTLRSNTLTGLIVAGLLLIAPCAQAAGTEKTVDQRADRDLLAQERMAIAADHQAADVSAQTLLLGLSLFGTLAATIVSGVALIVAIGTGRRQLRAYVMPDSFVMLHPTLRTDYAKLRPKPADQPAVHITLKNSGPTPASEVLHWAAFEFHPVKYENTLKLPETMEPISQSALAPGGSITKVCALAAPLTREQADQLKDGSSALYVYGITTYRDAFKRMRKSTYRLNYSGTWPPPAGTSFTFCDQGNHVE